MADENETEQEVGISIYVMPTIEGAPPRAMLVEGDLDEQMQKVEEEGMTMIVGNQVSWSNDMGAWLYGTGMPVPPDLGEAITAHAKSLGVEW